jgi:hypothetical protein
MKYDTVIESYDSMIDGGEALSPNSDFPVRMAGRAGGGGMGGGGGGGEDVRAKMRSFMHESEEEEEEEETVQRPTVARVRSRGFILEEEEDAVEDDLIAKLRAGTQVNSQGLAFAYLDQVTAPAGGRDLVTAPGDVITAEERLLLTPGSGVIGGGGGAERGRGDWGIQLEGIGNGGGLITPGGRGVSPGGGRGSAGGRRGEGGEGEVLNVVINSDEQKLYAHLQVLCL